MARSKKRKPVTAEEIERWFDILARLMHKAGKDAELLLPIWRALDRELNARREADTILAAAHARLTRSMDRISAPSL